MKLATKHLVIEAVIFLGGSEDSNHADKITVRTPGLIERLKDRMLDGQSSSTQDLAKDLDISKSNAAEILKKISILILTTFRWCNELRGALEMCDIDFKELNHNKIVFTHEAHFWLDGYVSSQNYRI